MKKRIEAVLLIIILFLLMIINNKPYKINATDIALIEMEITYYMSTGKPTASGCKTREGICAMKKEWLGKTAIVYEYDNGKVGDLIGIYEILDTGYGRYDSETGLGTIEAGKTIDIFVDKKETGIKLCKQTNSKVYVQIVDAVG